MPEGLFKILDHVPPYTISVQDLSSLSDKDATEAVEGTKQRMSHQSFDTTTWPLFEVRVSAISETKHILHIDFDHIILDMKGMISCHFYVVAYTYFRRIPIYDGMGFVL